MDGKEYYNVFRWYRGWWGRYTQADSLFTAGRSDYVYAFANPISLVDPKGQTPQSFWRNEDETCLMCTVYAESRGQSTACQQAVASVILNRLAQQRARGNTSTICSVVSARGQFDGYNNANYQQCANGACRPAWPRELEQTLQNFQNGFPIAPEGATFFGNNTPVMTRYFSGTLGLTRVPYPACPTFQFYRR
jgi:hypothetical protein